jgi:hypothetical protein
MMPAARAEQQERKGDMKEPFRHDWQDKVSSLLFV